MPRIIKSICALVLCIGLAAAAIIMAMQVGTALESCAQPLGQSLADAALPQINAIVKENLDAHLEEWINGQFTQQVSASLADEITKRLDSMEGELKSLVASLAPDDEAIMQAFNSAIHDAVEKRLKDITFTPNDLWRFIAAMAQDRAAVEGG
nr:hypothetical protein [bacterium]